MIYVHTANSTYQLDMKGKRIRRIRGRVDPTPRFSPDGEWKEFEMISAVRLDTPLQVIWNSWHADYTIISEVTATQEIGSVVPASDEDIKEAGR